jgi:twitching motility protein PilT
MPRLDPLIERLLNESALDLTLTTGAGGFLRTSEGRAHVIRQALTSQQIIGAITEMLPADMKSSFRGDGPIRFPYLSRSGAVEVRVQVHDERIEAAIVPMRKAPPAPEPEPEPDEEKLELVSGAEMMNLAAAQMGGAYSAPAPAAAAAPPPARAAPAPAKVAPISPLAAGDAATRMEHLLKLMLDRGASDLHLTSQSPPMLRVDGDIVAVEEAGILLPEQLKAMLWTIAPERAQAQWEQRKDTDFAHETDAARFRVNVFADRKGIGAVLRQIPSKILSAEEMGLSKPILDLCFLSKGLVLVTGPTGSGKSTTLAAMVDYINRNREDHIITIEDPIEFVHPNKKCLVNQREVGVHTESFKNALRAALREDPDIVLVGELRDLETIAIAIETAETGHLVFGTLHTNTAPSTVDRIIDQFPSDRQQQIRTMLSESLKGVVAQTLCKKIGGGRAAAQEVLICTGGVSNLIREGKTFQLPSIMQTGRNVGMVTMNEALFDLVKRKVVAPRDAYIKSIAKAEFKALLERGGFKLELEEK